MENTSIQGNKLTLRRKAALFTAFASILMFFAAMGAEVGMRQNLILPNDAAATFDRVRANEALFWMGLLGYATVLICDLIVSWGFWRFFQPVNKSISGIAGLVRIGYTVAFGVACYRLVQGGMAIFEGDAEATGTRAMDFFNRYEVEWSAALIAFGVHLLLIAVLSWRSNEVPKWLAAVIAVAGSGYILDNLAKLTMENYAVVKPVFLAILALSSIGGEVGMAVWMLMRGGKGK
ncbi:MAG: DUF4386 domain-containing protein [Bacteroidia bacterium]